ncbi:hypothetical protein [Levilactobacillus acidifarinae]|uniref:Uncharacterized protein n=1 Tax=Levilactobacillus acidifarinae DSM 19394 = JCM 15949 TaxID=1423715 RepID=A0A0R1LSP8_9LACO|nr:hypothetical protein [Levilactobacillus acidifarinae]KRK95338.1 hypothetical protein FD25_GL001455 [Levilactobacillus acidifarinae DSM 19394]GEO70069.1 hypothetical protein LAC03_19790 [Levilactobacillus acidifarinae]
MKVSQMGIIGLLMVGVGLTMPTASADHYSARRAHSVKVVWRQKMGPHRYHVTRDARYSRHFRVRYATHRRAQRTVWVTDAHQKVTDRYRHTTAIYYHVKSQDGQHSGWIWRGYLRGV